MQAFLCIDNDHMRRIKTNGEHAIVQECAASGDEEVVDLLDYIVHQTVSEKQYANGVRDKGRPPTTTLHDFLADRRVGIAGLERAHVIALRLCKSWSCVFLVLFLCLFAPPLRSLHFAHQLPSPLRFSWFLLLPPLFASLFPDTTAAYWRVNNPLRDRKRYQERRPHPLPATVFYIQDGIKKLRAAVVEETTSTNNGTNNGETKTTGSGVVLWRGMKNVHVSERFKKEGGTELAPMSTTSDLNVAIQYVNFVLMFSLLV